MSKINRTVKRALDILQLLQSVGTPLTNKEISEKMNIPIASTFDIVYTLLNEGVIEYSGEGTRKYVIGARAFEIGAAYLRNTNITQIVAPYVQRLMYMSNATSFFAIEHERQIIYMDKAEAPTQLRTSAELGSRRELHSTGLGKAILASYDDDSIRNIYSGMELTAYTPYTITDLGLLLEDITMIRGRGYSIDNQEGNEGVSCIASAVKNYTGKPVGAISIAMMAAHLTEEAEKRFGLVISQFAAEISSKLGYNKGIYEELYHIMEK